MTRLPVDSWEIHPRLDLGEYQLNNVCPITGKQGDLDDHHIVRRSHTALGRDDNQRLFWVEVDGRILPNRVAIDPIAHERITQNRARLEWGEDGLFYVEGTEAKRLDISFRLMTEGEKVSVPRKTRAKNEKPRRRQTFSVRAPVDAGENGVEILEGLIDGCRQKYAESLGWADDVPDYFVIVAVLAKDLQG